MKQHRMWQLLRTGFWLGATIFGGITVAYPAIRRRAVERGWLTGEEVDGLYAVAVFLPGPSFLNLWGAVSARVGGVAGAVVGQFGLLLPSFLLVCTLPLLARVPYVAAHTAGIMRGAVWATVGLLLAAGLQGWQSLESMAAKVLAPLLLGLLLLGLHPLLLLVVAVVGGVLWALRLQRGV